MKQSTFQLLSEANLEKLAEMQEITKIPTQTVMVNYCIELTYMLLTIQDSKGELYVKEPDGVLYLYELNPKGWLDN